MKDKYKSAVAQLDCESGIIGTAFLIDKKRAITARHTIDEHLESGSKVFLDFVNKEFPQRIEAKVIFPAEPYIGIDIAILEINEEISDISPLTISSRKVESGSEWIAYGYSNTRRNSGGEVFSGLVKQANMQNISHEQYDLDLACHHPQIIDTNYEVSGASGSPILINDNVVGVLSDKVPGSSIGGVSIISCFNILKEYTNLVLNDDNHCETTGFNYVSINPPTIMQTATLSTLQAEVVQAKDTTKQLIKDFPIDSQATLLQRLDEVVSDLINLSPDEIDNYLRNYRFPYHINDGDIGLEQLIEILTLIKSKFTDAELVFNDQIANLCIDEHLDYYNLLVFAV